MPTLTNLRDAWVHEGKPSKNYSNSSRLKLAASGSTDTKYSYLFWGRPFERGTTLLTGKLQLWNSKAITGSVTITVERLVEPWAASRVKWTNKPGVGGTAYTKTISNAAANTMWEIDILPMLQYVSNGGAWYGVRISISGTSTKVFHSSQSSDVDYRPQVVVAWAEAPEPPENPSPDHNAAVSMSHPMLTMDFIDLAGDTTLQALEVQIDDTEDFTAPLLFESGWVETDVPEYDLQSSGAPVTDYSPYVLADSPVIYYRLGDAAGTTTMVDSAPGGVNGVYSTTGSARVGASLLASDPNTSYAVPAGATAEGGGVTRLDPIRTGSSWSVEAWVHQTSTSGEQLIVGRETAGIEWSLRINAGKPRLYVNAGSLTLSAPNAIPVNTTAHIVVTFNTTTDIFRMYVNGTEVATATYGTAHTVQSGSTLRIGSWSSAQSHILGRMDELAIYLSTLSPARITAHYQAGTGIVMGGFAGLAEDQSVFWRARVRDGAGVESSWMEIPAQMRRVSKTSLTLNGLGTTADPEIFFVEETSPTLSWTLGAPRTQTSYSLKVVPLDDPDKPTFATGKVTSTDNTITTDPGTIPKKDGAIFEITLRVWDDIPDRVKNKGDLPYYEVVKKVIYQPATGITEVTNAAATPAYPWPWVDITFNRTTAPDSFAIFRDGELVEDNITPGDIFVSGTQYRFRDKIVGPRKLHTWEIVANVNGEDSQGVEVTGITKTGFTWLMTLDGSDPIVFTRSGEPGPVIEATNRNFQEVHQPFGGGDPVLITQFISGFDGRVEAILADDIVAGLTAQEMLTRFKRYRRHSGQKVLLVGVDETLKVVPYNFSYRPRSRGGKVLYDVSFDFFEVGVQ